MTADFGSFVPKTKFVPKYVRNKPDNGIQIKAFVFLGLFANHF